MIKERMPREDLLSWVRQGKKLSTGQQLRLISTLSLPAILAQITSVVMQYIDASMVGRLGASQSASIGLVSTSTWLLGSVAFAYNTGFSVQVAHLVGAGKEKEARNVFRQGLLVISMISLVLAAVGISISGTLPVWLGGSADIARDAGAYFMIYTAFIPAMGLNALAGGMLQCSGNMKIPGILNALCCLWDVVLNAILIFPSGRIQVAGMTIHTYGAGLGVAGAALGTVLAELITASMMLYFACVKSPILHFRKGDSSRITRECQRKAAKLALPVVFEHLVICGAMVMTTRIVAPLGTIALAANSFAVTAESLCYMPGYGIADAATTLVGQSIGAGRKDLVRLFARRTVHIGMLLMAGIGVVMFFAAPWMMALLTPNLQVQQLGSHVLKIEAFAEPMYAASIVVSGALRGAGDTLIPSIMNFGSLWLVRLPLSYFLAESCGLTGVWIAMCTELIFRGMIFLIRLYGERWRKEEKNESV